MKESFKRFFITIAILSLSVATAVFIDRAIDKNDREEHPLGEEESVREVISNYSSQYGIPEEVIYTVMKMRSDCNRFYDNDGRYGYMGLNVDDISVIKDFYDVEITEDMLRNPSYNLLFGVQIISRLYSELGDMNAVYAALIYGKESAAEWISNENYIDITGSLIKVPESVGDEFYEYLKTEEKYTKLYFDNK